MLNILATIVLSLSLSLSVSASASAIGTHQEALRLLLEVRGGESTTPIVNILLLRDYLNKVNQEAEFIGSTDKELQALWVENRRQEALRLLTWVKSGQSSMPVFHLITMASYLDDVALRPEAIDSSTKEFQTLWVEANRQQALGLLTLVRSGASAMPAVDANLIRGYLDAASLEAESIGSSDGELQDLRVEVAPQK